MIVLESLGVRERSGASGKEEPLQDQNSSESPEDQRQSRVFNQELFGCFPEDEEARGGQDQTGDHSQNAQEHDKHWKRVVNHEASAEGIHVVSGASIFSHRLSFSGDVWVKLDRSQIGVSGWYRTDSESLGDVPLLLVRVPGEAVRCHFLQRCSRF